MVRKLSFYGNDLNVINAIIAEHFFCHLFTSHSII